jgi:hypothetical protein
LAAASSSTRTLPEAFTASLESAVSAKRPKETSAKLPCTACRVKALSSFGGKEQGGDEGPRREQVSRHDDLVHVLLDPTLAGRRLCQLVLEAASGAALPWAAQRDGFSPPLQDRG